MAGRMGPFRGVGSISSFFPFLSFPPFLLHSKSDTYFSDPFFSPPPYTLTYNYSVSVYSPTYPPHPANMLWNLEMSALPDPEMPKMGTRLLDK